MHDDIRAAIVATLTEANAGRVYNRLRFFTSAAEAKEAFKITEDEQIALQAAITYRMSLVRGDLRTTRTGDEIPQQRRHTFRILLLRGLMDSIDTEKIAQDFLDRVVDHFDAPEVRARFRAIRVKILPIEAATIVPVSWEQMTMHQADMRLECIELK